MNLDFPIIFFGYVLVGSLDLGVHCGSVRVADSCIVVLQVAHLHFPITVATVPFRIPNAAGGAPVRYETAASHVEGGLYIGPEFLLGQVYDGGVSEHQPVVLYRPVYVCVERGEQHREQQAEHAAN